MHKNPLHSLTSSMTLLVYALALTCIGTRPTPSLSSDMLLPIVSVLAWQVREVAMEAIERARRGEGPTLIEAQTYRFRGHSLADPDELREKKEKEYWQVQSCTPC